MKRSEQADKIFALIYAGDALLLLRKKGSDSWDLPYGKDKKDLRDFLQTAIGFEATNIQDLPPFIAYIRHLDVKMRFVLVEGAPHLEGKDYEILFAEYGSAEQRGLPYRSLLAYERGWTYAPFYKGMPRTVPFLEYEDEKVKWQIDCLHFFRRFIPAKNRKQFTGLYESAASFRRMNLAFKTLCETYRVDPKLYEEHLAYRRKRQEVLR